jgi:molecular chaperone GrpE (heat shock protein)
MTKLDKMMEAHSYAKEIMEEQELPYNEAFTLAWSAYPEEQQPQKRLCTELDTVSKNFTTTI